MIIEITEQELPEIFKYSFSNWQNIFKIRTTFSNKPFYGIDWIGEDKNLGAFNSLEKYIEWFSYFPKESEPYRDNGFYSREFTFLLSVIKPEVIVELGTDKGMGTFMISKLCPDYKKFYSVDNRHKVSIPGDIWVESGYIAKKNLLNVEYIVGSSWETKINKRFNFCFIDANHNEEEVYKDSVWAWNNRDKNKWLIVWHDYRVGNPEFEGLIRSVNRFSDEVGINVYKLKDSSVVWAYNL